MIIIGSSMTENLVMAHGSPSIVAATGDANACQTVFFRPLNLQLHELERISKSQRDIGCNFESEVSH